MFNDTGFHVTLRRRRILAEEVKIKPKTKKQKQAEAEGFPPETKKFYEDFTIPTIKGYRMDYVKSKLREMIRRLINNVKSGNKSPVEGSFEKLQQVNTAMGQLKNEFKDFKFTFGWTTNEENNTLFVITPS